MKIFTLVLRILIGAPISILYVIASELRRAFFRFLIKPVSVNAVVVSVGNITSGGTGKTPFVNELVQYFTSIGKRVVIVSRSYKAKARNPVKVDFKAKDASLIYGDEPTLLARKNPNISVWVGPSKSNTTLEVVRRERPDVVIVDDGFQHLKLKRDFDFVLVDATEPIWHYLPLPAGYARDAFWRVENADLVILTKENLANQRERDRAVAFVEDAKNAVRMNYQIKCLRNLKTGEDVAVHDLKHIQKVLLVSGIGRPYTFESLIQRESHFGIAYHKSFSDHHQFTEVDRQSIETIAGELSAEAILLTEKDAVRLAEPFSLPTYAVTLKVEIVGLHEKLNELFH